MCSEITHLEALKNFLACNLGGRTWPFDFAMKSDRSSRGSDSIELPSPLDRQTHLDLNLSLGLQEVERSEL